MLTSSDTLHNYYQYCLPALNISSSQLKSYHGVLFCKKLYVASQAIGIYRYLYPEARIIWDKIANFYRDYNKNSHLEDKRKIFISRSGIPKRTLLNQSELEAFFTQLGLYICHPEELTLPQQVALFANADHVACPYGSGMFNVLFAQKPVSLLVIGSDPHFFTHFPYYDDRFEISAYLEHYPPFSTSPTQSAYDMDWAISDMANCKAAIEDWLFSAGK